jgi:hypothetical protein
VRDQGRSLNEKSKWSEDEHSSHVMEMRHVIKSALCLKHPTTGHSTENDGGDVDGVSSKM